MGYGIAAGVFWALETVLIGAALRCAPFLSSDQAILLAPFVSTFLHDFCSALWISIFNLIKGEWKNSFAALKNPDGRIAALAALIGGPVGMTGYVLAVNNLGASLGAVASAVSGKRVVMVDDSIVRGTTSARIVGLLRSAGAKEVHVRISSPPFRFPCYFGTDIDSQENLIACRFTDTAEIAEAIGADSLAYLSVEDAKKLTSCDICHGCFTGEYPADVSGCGEKNKFEQKIHK